MPPKPAHPHTVTEGPSGVRVSEIVVAVSHAASFTEVAVTRCVVCIAGSGALQSGAGSVPLKKGTIAVRSPGWSGQAVAGRLPLRLVVFEWPPAAVRALGRVGRGLAQPRTFDGRSSVELAWRAAGELRIGDIYTPHAIQCFADGVAVGLARNLLYGSGAEPTLGARARTMLDRQLTSTVSLRALARTLGCSAEHLSRHFKKVYGIAPRAYVLRRRIEQARDALAYSARSVEEIAQQLGFHDASHFARHFRRATGLSPKSFRARQSQIKSVPK